MQLNRYKPLLLLLCLVELGQLIEAEGGHRRTAESPLSVVRCDSEHTGPENQAQWTHPH